MNLSGIQPNQTLQPSSVQIKEAQVAQPIQQDQEKQTGLQQPLRSNEQEPQISADGSRLAAVATSNETNDKPPAITDSSEAQQVKNRLQQNFQVNPNLASDSQKTSAESVRALLSA